MTATCGDGGDRSVRWVTGGAALAAGLLLLVTSPLYVALGDVPSLRDAAGYAAHLGAHAGIALTTKLVDTIFVIGIVVFVGGFRQLVRVRLPHDTWMADLVFGSGLVYGSVVLVGDVLAAAAAMDALVDPDPTVVRALSEAALPAFGAIGFLMAALFLGATSHGVRKLGMAPLHARAGWVLAMLNIAAVPSIYRGRNFLQTVIDGGNAVAGPYSYISAAAGGLASVWLVVLGILILRRLSAASPLPD